VVSDAGTDTSGDPVLDWLLSGDVAAQFRTTRDLLHRDASDLQARIPTEGHGAALLAARGANGHWGRGFYQPKWTSSHYTLLELAGLGLDPTTAAARETVGLVLEHKGRDGGLNPSGRSGWSDVCVNGMALTYCCYFGADGEQLRSVVDFVLRQQVGDGGFNCQSNRSGATHSSVHTSVSVIEGITEYLRGGYEYRAADLARAREGAVEFLLRHRMYRSETTGEPIRAEFVKLHHPARWYYDILRGLDALADAGVPYDARMDDALGVLRARRRPDGRWTVNRGYPGLTHVPPPRAGQPDRWVTLAALRVLAAYPGPRE
jgi:hypothetical protein